MSNLVNAMSVDVEDYFQVSAFETHISREQWDNIPHRIDQNIDHILEIFSKSGISATFFVLGWIAYRYPEIVRKIADHGHEIASHGYSHTRITNLNREQFKKEIIDTRKILEDISGTEVIGYRAPSYSINENNSDFVHEELEKSGHRYSSSIYPVKHDLYGIPHAPRFSYYPENRNILEIPVTTFRILGRNIPCGGGGYFRLYPYYISSLMLKYINKSEKEPCIFYFHPWELDENQPRQKGIGMRTRFRHYLNIHRMEERIKNLIADFEWGPVKGVYKEKLKNNQIANDI